MNEIEDFSQYGEQKAILEALGDGPGRFLDIGAWHPTRFSNTRALWLMGWSGVMIEPSPGPMLNLLKEYGNDPRVALIQAAVSTIVDLVLMHVTDDAVSTSDTAEFQRWCTTASFHGEMLVPTITLEDLANRYGGFDFVNIDAEGHSTELFLRMLQLEHFPRVVCVEHESRTTEILEAATKRNYRAVLVNSTNIVVVR